MSDKYTWDNAGDLKQLSMDQTVSEVIGVIKGGFPVMAETTRNHIFSKEISQVIIAAMVLAPISIEKIVCE